MLLCQCQHNSPYVAAAYHRYERRSFVPNPLLVSTYREAIDLMLGTDPSQPIPSAVELLRHPWFPVAGIEDKDAVVPMPLAPGEKVPVGPPVRPERVPTGLPPMVPKVSDSSSNGVGRKSTGATLPVIGSGAKPSPWVEMPDGSQAMSAWLMKKTDERNAIGLKSSWWVGGGGGCCCF